MPPYVLRLAYVAQFLLALIAVWTLWSQVGGQSHLDLMPWYSKLALSVTLSWVVVMGTIAAVSDPRAWNRKVIAYLIIGLCLAAGMAALTYFYHTHEEEGVDEDAPTTAILMPALPSVPCAEVNV